MSSPVTAWGNRWRLINEVWRIPATKRWCLDERGWCSTASDGSLEDAISKARQQRDELIAGDKLLRDLNENDTSDEAYRRVQAAMEIASAELSGDGWSHKYWFLIHHTKVDDYHSPRYQRFHLLKLLQMPPDHVGILDTGAPRFICAGRFLAAARELAVPVTLLNTILNHRDGGFHRYWRVGTTVGDTAESQWPVMRDGGFVSIGWHDTVPDLSAVIGQGKASDARERIREWLLPRNPNNPAVAGRKAGEILKFAQDMAENDLVVAGEGQKALGVGRIADLTSTMVLLNFHTSVRSNGYSLSHGTCPLKRD